MSVYVFVYVYVYDCVYVLSLGLCPSLSKSINMTICNKNPIYNVYENFTKGYYNKYRFWIEIGADCQRQVL